MQIQVAQQLKEPIGSTRTYEFEEEDQVLTEGVPFDYRGRAHFLRTDKGILVTAEVQTSLKGTCSRCLSSFSFPLRVVLEEEFFPSIDVLTGVPLEAPSRDAFTIDKHHILDLSEAVRQYTLASIPMKPLCKFNCAGLCSECGANLNEESCNCAQDRVDPRWTVLQHLLVDK